MASAIRVGVLDEQEVIHHGLRGGCSDLAGIAITGAYYRSGSATRAVARGDIDLLIMEYRLKGREGFNFICNLKIQHPKLRILVYLADPCPATIAELWNRSPKTVSTQKQAVYRKLGLKSDMDLFRKLAQYGDCQAVVFTRAPVSSSAARKTHAPQSSWSSSRSDARRAVPNGYENAWRRQ